MVADRARAAAARARGRDRPQRVAARRRGRARGRLRRQAAGVARGRAGARRVRRSLGLPGPVAGGACCSCAAAGAVYVVVALSWLTATLLVPGPRSPVRDRLDERQRVERGVRVQRHRPAERQIARTAGHGLRTGSPLPGGHPVRARPHPDRAPPPPRACWRASDRCRASASGWRSCSACSGHPGADLGVRGRRAAAGARRSPRCPPLRWLSALRTTGETALPRRVQPAPRPRRRPSPAGREADRARAARCGRAPARAPRGGRRAVGVVRRASCCSATWRACTRATSRASRRRWRRCSGSAWRGRLHAAGPPAARRARRRDGARRLLHRAPAVRAPGDVVDRRPGGARCDRVRVLRSRARRSAAPGPARAVAPGSPPRWRWPYGGARGPAERRHRRRSTTASATRASSAQLPGAEQEPLSAYLRPTRAAPATRWRPSPRRRSAR